MRCAVPVSDMIIFFGRFFRIQWVFTRSPAIMRHMRNGTCTSIIFRRFFARRPLKNSWWDMSFWQCPSGISLQNQAPHGFGIAVKRISQSRNKKPYSTEFYPINFEAGIILSFVHINSGIPFTTIRKYTIEKLKKYQSMKWETFKMVRK